MGRDSDDPRARGEVGRVGVAIDSIEDMRDAARGAAARQDLDVDDHQRDRGDPALPLRRRRRGAGRAARRRSAARSRTTSSRSTSRAGRTSTRRARRSASSPTSSRVRARGAEVEHHLDQRLPHPRGGLRRRAGARVHAGRRHRLRRRRRVDAGLDVDTFGAQLSFFFNVHNNLIEEVAKFRAARRMWSAHHEGPLRREDRPRARPALPLPDGRA